MVESQSIRKALFAAVYGLPLLALAWMWFPFVNAIILAVVVSVLTYSPYRRSRAKWEAVLESWNPKRKKLGPEERGTMADNLGALTVVVGTLLALAIPLTIVGLLLATQVNEFIAGMQASAAGAQTSVNIDYVVAQLNNAIAPVLQSLGGTQFNLNEWFDKNRESLTSSLGQGAGNAAYVMAHGGLMFVVAMLTSFFMLRDGHRLKEPAMALIPLPREGFQRILDRVANTIRAVFVGVMLVGVVQGTLAGIAYALAGIPNSLMWGVATIVFCLIPMLGAPLVYVPMGLLLLSQGKILQGTLLLVFGFAVISNIDNILKPLVIGARTQLHTMAVFFSLLGGILVMGPIGLFAGPMALATVLGLYDVWKADSIAADAKSAPSA